MSLWDRPYGPQNGAANSAAQTSLNQQAQGTPVLPAQLNLTSSSEAVLMNPSESSAPLLVQLPPNLPSAEQTPIDVVISGYIKTTATGTVELKVYEGTSATVGSDTKIADSGAVTQNTATAPFMFYMRLVYDSVSGKMGGWFEGVINNTLIARTALSNVVSGLSNAATPVLSLLLSATSSGATSGDPTTVNVEKFSIG